MYIPRSFLFLFSLCVLSVILSVEPHQGCPFHQQHQQYHPYQQYQPHQQHHQHQPHQYPNSGRNEIPGGQTNSRGSTSCVSQNLQCNSKNIYYSYDGSCNNLQNPSWGQSQTQYTRFLPANYADSKCALRKASNGRDLSYARYIRTTLLEDREIPATQKFNILYYGFGQWADHDVASSLPMQIEGDCCQNAQRSTSLSGNCLPINVPEQDKFYSQFGVTCLDLKRVNNSHTLKCDLDKPCVPINFQTGMFDLSVFYGPNSATVNDLRLFKGGLLKYSNDSTTKYHVNPPIVNGATNCPLGGIDRQPGGTCWKTGDARAQQNPEISIIEFIFYKLHQLIASSLGASKMKDEEIFQEARRYLIAAYQHIIYSEFVPITIGQQATQEYNLQPREQGYATYKPNVILQTLVEYTFAVGRAAHSLIKGSVTYGERSNAQSYLLRDKYFSQRFLLNENTFHDLMYSYTFTESNAQDEYGSEEISNYLLFNRTNGYGLDLQAIDILRGLDAGLSPYNAVRSKLGLRKFQNFDDMRGESFSNAAINKLKLVYPTVDDIDLYIGGLLEKPRHDSSVGPTFTKIIAESFYRWKYADRLFYEFAEAGFSSDELREIRKFSFAYLLCTVNPKQKVPMKAFMVPSYSNPLVDCHRVLQQGPNLKVWKSLYSNKLSG